MLDVGAEDKHLASGFDPIGVGPAGMVVFVGDHPCAAVGLEGRPPRLQESKGRSHLIQGQGKVLLLHLSCEDALQLLYLPAPAEGADGKVPSRIVGRRKEGEPLDVVPVKVREGDEHGPHLLVGTRKQVLAEVPDAAARVQDRYLTSIVRQPYTGRVAAEVLEVSVANRDRTPGAVEPGLDNHPCSSC